MGGNRDVMTTRGPVRGQLCESVVAFKGIPYARSPVGTLRFAAPEPPCPWREILSADDYGPVAPQLTAPLEALLGGVEAPQSEAGCLTLNVWTPAIDGAKRPVMVWIHGGAFVGGSGAATWYDGTALASRGDVVVVTLNYRLGLLGFMYLGDATGDEVPGNFGLLDQLAALDWVRENAAAFGGDPECVTAFGQSAGAMSIGALFGSPRLPALAGRAVLQSGACAHTLSVEAAERNSAILLDRLGLSQGAPDLLASLRALPASALLDAQALPLPESVDGMCLLPVVDGVSLTKPPLEAVAGGALGGMDLLIGTNEDEARLFMLTDPSLADMDDEELVARASEIWGPDKPGVALRNVEHYRRARPNAPLRDVWSAISTDKTFRIPAIRLAEAASAAQQPGRGSTFAYKFTWPTPAFGGVFGSCHSLEIPFVFDNLHKPGMAQVTGWSGEARGGGDGPLGDPAALAGAMADAWVAFARHGKPVLAACGDWVPYGRANRGTMRLDAICGMIEDPDGEERSLWEGAA